LLVWPRSSRSWPPVPGDGALNIRCWRRELWAVAHLVQWRSRPFLFGSILAWAVYDRISLKRRADVPAPAVATGGGYRNDFIVVVVGTLFYFVLGFWFHPWVIGVPVFRV
jgi:uncharacterized membrane protein